MPCRVVAHHGSREFVSVCTGCLHLARLAAWVGIEGQLCVDRYRAACLLALWSLQCYMPLQLCPCNMFTVWSEQVYACCTAGAGETEVKMGQRGQHLGGGGMSSHSWGTENDAAAVPSQARDQRGPGDHPSQPVRAGRVERCPSLCSVLESWDEPSQQQ